MGWWEGLCVCTVRAFVRACVCACVHACVQAWHGLQDVSREVVVGLANPWSNSCLWLDKHIK